MKTLVICVRGFHCGYLGCHGNGWIRTPALDRLAAAGVVFDQHLADVPDTRTARRSWRDGRHHFPGPEVVEAPSGFDLLDALNGAGVKSVLVAEASHPVPQDWLQGWTASEVVQAEGEENSLELTLETARAALEDLAEEPDWLLWIDLASLLPPWRVPADFSNPYFQDSPDEEGDEAEGEPLAEADEEAAVEDPLTPWPDPPTGPIHIEDDIDFCRLQSTYAGAVSYLDAGIGVLLEELDRLGLGEECAVILIADHGQALGEHGFCGPHRPWLHDELIHVPLLMRLPTSLRADRSPGVRVSALTQNLDLVPTLLELHALPVPPDLHGISLLPLAREDASAATRSQACCGLRIGEAIEWCLRTPEWSFVLPVRTPQCDPPRAAQLFVKPDDRWEANNVLHHHLDQADQFEQQVRACMDASHQPGPLRISTEREPEA